MGTNRPCETEKGNGFYNPKKETPKNEWENAKRERLRLDTTTTSTSNKSNNSSSSNNNIIIIIKRSGAADERGFLSG